jgi:hypothetical protein
MSSQKTSVPKVSVNGHDFGLVFISLALLISPKYVQYSEGGHSAARRAVE